MARRKHKKQTALSGSLGVFLGVALCGLLIYVLMLGHYQVNWEARARQVYKLKDYSEAVSAASKCLEEERGNFEALMVRAQSYTALRMFQRALSDTDRLLEINPNSSAAIKFKGSLLSSMERHDDSIAFYDETLERIPDDVDVRLLAAKARLKYFDQLLAQLLDDLERHHPHRLALREYLDNFYAASIRHSRHFKLLVDPIPGQLLAEKIGANLERTWALLHEADALMQEPTAKALDSPPARIQRAEIGLRLGRLLSAKLELQILLRKSLSTTLRNQVLLLLSKVLHKLGAHEFEAECLTRRIESFGGLRGAPLTLLADLMEAQFEAAEQTPALRLTCIKRLDRHLRTYRDRDIRSVGYRGIAALEWEQEPKRAISYLSDVLNVLKMQRNKDPSVSEPNRAKRFILALISAYTEDRKPGKAMGVIGTLLDLAPRESEFMLRRSSVLMHQGFYGSASKDLLRAMRTSPRNMELFDQWVESASKVKDINGLTPMDHAKEAADRWLKLGHELEDELAYLGLDRFRRDPNRISKRMAAIGELAARAEERPIVAWLMAEEFGRQGEILESREFLFKAAAKEPLVMVFLYRLGQYRLDLGMYEEAARDFEKILERDLTDGEVAELAVQSWRLAGNLERARELRLEVMMADPRGAGLHLAVQAALEQGDVEAARGIIDPYSKQTQPTSQHLVARVLLAERRPDEALQVLRPLLTKQPESAGLLRDTLLALAGTGRIQEFLKLAERFVGLPRLLPSSEIEEMLTSLEQNRLYLEAAFVADKVSDRYFDEVALKLKSRAALDGLLGGKPTLLRNLRDQKFLAPRLSDELVRAAFGLTLREDGAHAAANYLRNTREFQHGADWAVLPIAAAFSLTPYRIEHSTFLTQYHTEHLGSQIPLEDTLMWWLTYSRSQQRRSQKLQLEPGAEAEITWLKSSPRAADGTPAEAEYLRFLLFQFAGPGFEDDAAQHAALLLKVGPEAQTAVRYLCRRLSDEGKPEAALELLSKTYKAASTDIRSYELLGQLMLANHAGGEQMAELGAQGAQLFPTELAPLRFSGLAEAARGNLKRALKFVDRALDRSPGDLRTLKLMAQLSAADPKSQLLARRLAQIVSERQISDPGLLAFLAQRFGNKLPEPGPIIRMLQSVLRHSPRSYDIALAMARQLAASKGGQRLAELEALAKHVARVIPGDPDAARHAKTILAIANIYQHRELFDQAATIVRAANLANPFTVELHTRHADFLQQSGNRAGAIDELRLAFVLAPQNIEILFRYGELVLTERTDQSRPLIRTLLKMRRLAHTSPRYQALLGAVMFQANQLQQAGDQYLLAVKGDPKNPEYRYRLGLMRYLDRQDDEARKAFSRLPRQSEYGQLCKPLLETIGQQS